MHRSTLLALVVSLFVTSACRRQPPTEETAGAPSSAPVRLTDDFSVDRLEGTAAPAGDSGDPIVWRFDGEPPAPKEVEESDEEDEGEPDEPRPSFHETFGFEPFLDVENLRIEDDRLCGEVTGANPTLFVEREDADEGPDDVLHSIEFRMRVSAGTKMGMRFFGGPERPEREEDVKRIREAGVTQLSADLSPGDTMTDVVIHSDSSIFSPSFRISGIRRMEISPTDAAEATFEIESIRMITRREHFARIPSGVSWQGLGDVFRQTMVLRAPETASFDVDLPARPWLDLAIGTPHPHPVTFEVNIVADGATTRLLRRTVTTPDRWETVPIDLTAHAGRTAELRLSVHSDEEGATGFFGTSIVRDRVPPTEPETPQGVIVVLADTLRRDHLDAWGYERETAPFLHQLAREGALFSECSAQATWTKVSIPSILTSLYPATHGIVGPTHRLPDSVTTLAEVYQAAGYATLQTSSVAFSGKATNLQQGVDVLHERASVPDLEHSSSKTARTFVDRLVTWLEGHKDDRFFVFLHVFDPHSPFRPYAPYDELWSGPTADADHEADVETLSEWQKENDEEESEMPPRDHFDASGVAVEPFVAREHDWYDESIRGMDQEMKRLFERLEELGLRDKTLVAFTSDHGEEFLEHGKHFHGQSAYGELSNVPLFLWGPKWIRSETVDELVQSIDLMPTLLAVSELTSPEEVQGQNLLPLAGIDGARAHWKGRPAFVQRLRSGFEKEYEPDDIESYAMVSRGYRLIHNITRPDGHPEFELYDHAKDPLNAHDIAVDHPEEVARMTKEMEAWLKWATSRRAAVGVEGGEDAELSAADIEMLEQLGYLK